MAVQEPKSMMPPWQLFSCRAAIAFLIGIGSFTFSASSQILTLPLIPRGSVWRYLDNGSNQGTNWIGLGFHDESWASGPARLGYGGDTEVTTVSYGPNSGAKYITSYFRRMFEVTDRSAFRALKLRLVRDDGAVVYFNGVEVFRSNMPATPITYTTTASVALGGGDEFIAVETNLPPTVLRDGTNIVAVEVHQQSGTSSDIGFDLALDGEYSTTPQSLRLNAATATNQIAVTWPQLSVGHILQSTTRLAQSNQWSRVTNAISIFSTNNRVVMSATGSN